MEERETSALSQKEIVLNQLLGVAMIGFSFFLFYKAYQIYKSK